MGKLRSFVLYTACISQIYRVRSELCCPSLPPCLPAYLPPSDGLFIVDASKQGNLVGNGLAFAVMVGTVQSILSKATKVRYIRAASEKMETGPVRFGSVFGLVRVDSVRLGRDGSEPNERRGKTS